MILPNGIIRVTKEGKDALSETSLNEYFLDSDYPLLKVHDYGPFTTNTGGAKVINHTLGYIPYVMVFSQLVVYDGMSTIFTDEFYQHDWSFVQFGTIEGRTKIYDDNIDILVRHTISPANPGAVDGFYYIFTEEIT